MAKPKYDYKGKEFLDNVESMAKKGFTDKEIAANLNLEQTYFCDLKTKFPQISQVLTHARRGITAVVRAKFLAMALGGIKTKSTTKRKIVDRDGNLTGEDELQVTESELAPNLSAMSTWLYHYDEDWRNVERKQDEIEDKQSEGSIPISKWIENNTITPKEKE